MTPRRRISPQARKRYRNIKNFFKRATGSSQTEIDCSTPVNITDLKDKIVGLEQRLSEVSKTCREFMYLEGSRRETQSLVFSEPKNHIHKNDSIAQMQSHGVETNIMYESSENYRNPKVNDYTPNHSKEFNNENQCMKNHNSNTTKSNKKKSKVNSRVKYFDVNSNLKKHKSQTVFDNIGSACSASSFHSLGEHKEVSHSNPGYAGNQTDKRATKTEKKLHIHRKDEVHNKQLKRVVPKNYEDHRDAIKHSKNIKLKRGTTELDQDFIADIIKRQYKPVKLFGRKKSSMSQFSEPMCRDREFSHRESIREDTDLCSCCYGSRYSPKHHHHSYESDTRSVCDARLYSSKRNPRFKYHKVHADAYNDSELYDLIPVKEKSSPRTRRKFAQDNLANYHDYRQASLSPKKTHRPRLNLKAQYYKDSANHTDYVRHHERRVSPKRYYKYDESIETFENSYSSQILIDKKLKQRQKLQSKPNVVHEIGTMSSLQYPQHFDNEQNNTRVNTIFNNTQETVSSIDKTDKALFEIKDILQSFLQEIKKETLLIDKSDDCSKTTEKCVNNSNPQVNANLKPNSGHSFSNHIAPQCNTSPTPYIMPTYHACCYPVMPMYSMNCIQNGCVMPSRSFTCGCATNADDKTDKNKANNTTGNETIATETDELIKEIYKYVVQSPTFSRKQDDNRITEHETNNYSENRYYTTRSAGGSTRISKHDAKIGTPKMISISKSCEAVGSKMISDAYYSESNEPTYSDSIMENISVEPTATASFISELSNERLEKNKVSTANTKVGKLLRSFGLFKKKKREPIEYVTESESTIDVDILKKSPFRQEFASYMMTDQVYDRPPPVPHDYRHPHYPHDYQPPYNPAIQNFLPPPVNNPYSDPKMHRQEPANGSEPRHYPRHPTAPPYSNSYKNINQTEVKRGAQSKGKKSFFQKVKQKMQPPLEQTSSNEAKNYATQTKDSTPGFWKNLQAKNTEDINGPLTFAQEEHEKLGVDSKFRNAMLKRMFNKRNPFSSRNMIMRTLLGKDSFTLPRFKKAPMFML